MTRLDRTRPTERDRLEQMYWGSGMSTSEIASALNTTTREVNTAFHEHGIKRRRRKERPSYRTDQGYERSYTTNNSVYIHQLVMISEGEDPHKIFSGDYHIHHENEIRWDNRPENLELMVAEDHMRHHASERALGELGDKFEQKYTDSDLLGWIDSFVELNGFPPSPSHVKGWPGPSPPAYQTRFGSWNDAIREAGYEPRCSGEGGDSE